MRRLVITAALALTTSSASATELKLNPEQQKLYQEVALGLVFAHECDNRFDDPDLFRRAGLAFRKTLIGFDLEGAERISDEAIASIRNAPQEKSNGFSLATEEVCRKMSGRFDEILKE